MCIVITSLLRVKTTLILSATYISYFFQTASLHNVSRAKFSAYFMFPQSTSVLRCLSSWGIWRHVWTAVTKSRTPLLPFQGEHEMQAVVGSRGICSWQRQHYPCRQLVTYSFRLPKRPNKELPSPTFANDAGCCSTSSASSGAWRQFSEHIVTKDLFRIQV
jgi:hypothetical protein